MEEITQKQSQPFDGSQPHPCIEIFENNFVTHFDALSQILKSRVLENCLSNGLCKTLKKKQIIGDDEFQLEKAIAESSERLTRYIDKQQIVLRNNLYESDLVRDIYKRLQQKNKRINRKLDSITQLTERISEKMKRKRLQQEKAQFSLRISHQKIEIPQNPGFENAICRFNRISNSLPERENQIERYIDNMKRELNCDR